MRILVDSDAYIAIYSKDDLHHTGALKILAKLSDSTEFFTTWDVIDETTTKLSYYLTKTVARKFLDDVILSGTNIIYPDEDLLHKVNKKFNNIKTKRVSFTDCFNIVAYKDFEIDRVFSFDGIYKKQSLRILSLQDRVSK
jgi:predicted nucleic acid-binding protein